MGRTSVFVFLQRTVIKLCVLILVCFCARTVTYLSFKIQSRLSPIKQLFIYI